MLTVNLMPPPLPFAEARQQALRADPVLHQRYKTSVARRARLVNIRREHPDAVSEEQFREANAARSLAEREAIHADSHAHAEYLRSLSVKNHQDYKRKPWYRGTEEQKAKLREDWARMQADPARAANRRATRLARYHGRMATDEDFMVEQRLRARLRMAVYRGQIEQRDQYGIDWQAIVDHLGSPPGPASEYHIDHIRPLCSFDLNDPDQVRECFAPENHQWLLGPENSRKGGKV